MSIVPHVGERDRLAYRPGLLRRWFVGALAVAAFAAVALLLSTGLGLIEMARWAATQQRAFHSLVQQLLALDGAGPLAGFALVGACFVYGFVHAAIPGHGKFLIASAGLATTMTAVRLVVLSMLAACAQALTALILVYGSFALLDITAGWAQLATDRVLIPLSYVAVFAIGAVLVTRAVRGLRALVQRSRADQHDHHHHHAHDHHHDHGHHHSHGDGHDHHHHDAHCGCNHRHGPTVEEAQNVASLRDAAALIFSIGLRPCTGAVFVLVAAWRLGLLGVGAAGAFAMAIGTGAFISLVAITAVTARGATLVTAGNRYAAVVAPALQLLAGLAIIIVSLVFLLGSLLPPL